MDISTDPSTGEKDLMRITVAYPPNFELISTALPKAGRAHTYCYGDTIYNPSGKKVPMDIQLHELIHSKQQVRMGDVDAWWYKYLTDRRFRLEEELEAYGEQYRYAREHIEEASQRLGLEGKRMAAGKNNLLQWARESMARALASEEYGNLLSVGEAESAIRNYGPTTI